MVIATFGPTTGWAGKTINYEDGRFALEGVGPLTAADVLTYDRQGHLEWAYGGLREWVETEAQQTRPMVVPLMGSAVGGASSSPPATNRRPLLIVGVVVAAIIALILIVAAVGSIGSMDEAAGPSTGVDAAPAGGVMTTVFTWPGGGAGNDIRNSEPFTLNGGHQRVSVSSQEIVTEYSMSTQGWTLESADGGSEMEMVNPASFGESQSDLYLPAGSYYLSSNTIDCTWTLIVSEER